MKNRFLYSRVITLTLFLALTVGISSCETIPKSELDFATDSFLNDQPCAAPCWYGLVPGKSSKEDAYRVLAELPFVDQSTIDEKPYTMYGGEEIYVRCRFKDDARGVGFSIWDGVVWEISLSPRGLSFGGVVRKLGDPDHVRAIFNSRSGSYEVELFYVQQGIRVRALRDSLPFGDKYLISSEGGQKRALLSKEMPVSDLIYVPTAASIEEFYTSQLKDQDSVRGILELISPWPGWDKSVPMIFR